MSCCYSFQREAIVLNIFIASIYLTSTVNLLCKQNGIAKTNECIIFLEHCKCLFAVGYIVVR